MNSATCGEAASSRVMSSYLSYLIICEWKASWTHREVPVDDFFAMNVA